LESALPQPFGVSAKISHKIAGSILSPKYARMIIIGSNGVVVDLDKLPKRPTAAQMVALAEHIKKLAAQPSSLVLLSSASFNSFLPSSIFNARA